MGKFRKFMTGATAFTLLTVVTKLIGALYRIPLTNIIGAEGIGLYQMVFPLYTVFLTLTSGGVTTAMAKYVASLETSGAKSASVKALWVTMKFVVLTGGVAAVVIALFSRFISRIQGNSDAVLPYIGIAPALLFVAVAACFRGFFQGKQNLLPTALSQIAEQIVKLAAGLLFASIWMKSSVVLAVLGATLGVSISEVAAVAVLGVYYFVDRAASKRKSYVKAEKLKDAETAAEIMTLELPRALPAKKEIFGNIYKTAIPSALGSLVLPFTQLMDSMLIVNVLVGMGMESGEATALFGIVNGPINSLINLPVVVTLAISVALLPKLSALYTAGKDIKDTTLSAFVYTSILAIPCVAVFLFFPESVLSLLYTGGLSAKQLETAASLLRISSITVFYVSTLQVATATLQAVGKAHIPALNLLIGAFVKIAFTLLLLIKLGIAGAVIATVLCYTVTTALDCMRLKKLKIYGKGFYASVTAPTLAATVMTVVMFVMKKLLGSLSGKLCTIIFLITGGIVYVLFLFILKAIKKSDIKKLFGA